MEVSISGVFWMQQLDHVRQARRCALCAHLLERTGAAVAMAVNIGAEILRSRIYSSRDDVHMVLTKHDRPVSPLADTRTAK
jgi:hypothetical protein